MKWIEQVLKADVAAAITRVFEVEVAPEQLVFQQTRKDFEGDITVVVFPLVKLLKKAPQVVGAELGAYLREHHADVVDFNAVQGFLNLVLSDDFWLRFYTGARPQKNFGIRPIDPATAPAMVEYSSPNTNKPLHLGHIRNCLLGHSVSEIIKATGKPVVKVQIINDRGIHICKSMVAWKHFANGETPDSSGLKGDKLVGKYYVAYEKEFRRQVADLTAQGKSQEEAEAQAPIYIEARQMLLDWEAGDAAVVELWKTMNAWVYAGFDATYADLGVSFDKNYYESETYLAGKDLVMQGLERGAFYRRDDGSVWCDLTDQGQDEKLVLRRDGTSVYMTQDMGTAVARFDEYPIDQLIYTVGNEQDYHFDVLFKILAKLGFEWADRLYHLSYGMVDLPTGKMKSREGTVVDADDLLLQMREAARERSEELGKIDGMDEQQRQALYRMLGHGALKYFILRVDPKKRMMFNPEESIDFNGNTGPFIQYAHARIRAIERKASADPSWLAEGDGGVEVGSLGQREREVLHQLSLFPEVVDEAAALFAPSLIAQYAYDLTKAYNGFYQSESIFQADTPERSKFRVQLSIFVGNVLESALRLLGIDAPHQM